jgi:Ca2+-binding RTX toxin-like protein
LPPADTIRPSDFAADTIDGGLGSDVIVAWGDSDVRGGGGKSDFIIVLNGARRVQAGSGDDGSLSLAKVGDIDVGAGKDLVIQSHDAFQNAKITEKLDEIFPEWREIVFPLVDDFFREGGGLNTEFAALDGGASDDVIFAGDGANYLRVCLESHAERATRRSRMTTEAA